MKFTCDRLFWLPVLGSVLWALALFVKFAIPILIQHKIQSELPLVNGSDAFDAYVNVPADIFTHFYLFDVTNAENVTRGHRPQLLQRGPYTFVQRKQKHDVTFNDDETTVTFRERKEYFFDQTQSVGPLGDRVTIVNVPVIVISAVARRVTGGLFGGITGGALNRILKSYNEKLFVTRSVGEILFGGYNVDILADVFQWATALGISIPRLSPSGRFGLMYGVNGSDDGLMTVHTGRDDLSKLNTIESWNGQRTLDCWNGERCSKIEGTDGSLFPPPVDRNQTLLFFIAEANVTNSIVYREDVRVDGIPALRFGFPPEFYMSARSVADRACYCTRPEGDDPLCRLDGIGDLSSCLDGLPLIGSLPHFYKASLSVQNGVVGLHPDPAAHDSWMDIEQLTGVVLRAAIRGQLNIHMERNININLLKNIKDTIMPLMWRDETAMINDDKAKTIFKLLHNAILVADIVAIVAAAAGSLLLLASLVILLRKFRHEPRIKVTVENLKCEYSNLTETTLTAKG